MLIIVKTPTFMSMINFMLIIAKMPTIVDIFYIYEHDKFHAQLSTKEFYNLRASCITASKAILISEGGFLPDYKEFKRAQTYLINQK